MEAYWAEVRRAPSQDELRALLERGEHVELERRLEALQAAYERGESGEYPVFHAFRAFEVAGLELKLDGWCEARPDAWTAHAVRALHEVSAGFRARGASNARDTATSQFDAMGGHFARAIPALRAAIEVRPRFLPAYARLIDVATARGDDAGARAAVEAALARDPRSYLVRLSYMAKLEPRWGGSWEEMQQFALEAQAHAAQNPALVMLLGFAAADRALERVRARDSNGALQHYGEALRYGRRVDWLFWRAVSYVRLDQCGNAITDLDEMLRYEPDHADALAQRAECMSRMGQADESLRHRQRAFELEPGNSYVAQMLGKELERSGRWADAAAVYEKALVAKPDDPALLEQLAVMQRGPLRDPERARTLLTRATTLAPKRASAWRELGSTLQTLGDQVSARAAYDRYLALVDPSDPIERVIAPHIRSMLQQMAPPAATPE